MQLKDLEISKRIDALNIKASFTTFPYLENLSFLDYQTLKTGIKSLLKTEPEFFLLDEEILESTIEIITIYNKKEILKRLYELQNISINTKETLKNRYMEREYFKRGELFTQQDYLELIELDGLLLNEVNYNYILDEPYILNSISYLKQELNDYYKENKEANNYLYTILKILKRKKYYDLKTEALINSLLQLFPKDDKVITFAKRI